MTIKPYACNLPLRSKGFTLIEVLIAVLVLSIGLLGLAALQTSGLGMNHSAYLRTQATILAADMADRMRANRAGIGSSAYDNPSATAHSGCADTGGCTSTQLAENDMAQWQADLAARLPGGEGVVCEDSDPLDGTSPAAAACAGGTGTYAIKIWWRDDRNNVSNATGCDGNVRADGIQCFVVSLQP